MLTEATSYYEFDRMHRIDRIYYHIITIVSFADGGRIQAQGVRRDR